MSPERAQSRGHASMMAPGLGARGHHACLCRRIPQLQIAPVPGVLLTVTAVVFLPGPLTLS